MAQRKPKYEERARRKAITDLMLNVPVKRGSWDQIEHQVLEHGAQREKGRWSDNEWACLRLAYLLIRREHVTTRVNPRTAARMIGALADWHQLTTLKEPR